MSKTVWIVARGYDWEGEYPEAAYTRLRDALKHARPLCRHEPLERGSDEQGERWPTYYGRADEHIAYVTVYPLDLDKPPPTEGGDKS